MDQRGEAASSATRGDTAEGRPHAVGLARPALPAQFVERRRVTALLDQGRDLPLTLVSAPAGSGKTTAVAAWAARRAAGERTAWLTLDREDDRPGVVVPLAVESLRHQGLQLPAVGPHVPPGDRADLIDRMAAVLAQQSTPVTLVVDGFEHAATDAAGELELLVRHSRGRLRLVIITRADPALPLARYRLAESMVELRTGDLAFTSQETTRLVRVHRLALGSDAVATLHTRTRGWAAGLRFALMHLSACDHPEQAVRRLAGDTGNIAEYLMSEILQTLSPPVRDLLLRTSVVDVLQPGLIDELAGPTAARTLATLARANVLVEELTDRPGWFRYHPLLRDLLRAELAYQSPEERVRLHRAAAAWLARDGRLDAAVTTASAVPAWADAARHVVEGLALGRILIGDPGGLARKLDRMPDDVPGPAAAAVRAALVLADEGRTCGADEVSRIREEAAAGDTAHAAALVLAADVLEAVRAGKLGDPAAVTLADRALQSLAAQPGSKADAHPELSALLHLTKGAAQLRLGELDRARESLARLPRAPAHPAWQLDWEPVLVAGLGHLALIEAVTGDLRRARDRADQAAALAARTGASVEDRSPSAELALAWVCTEQCDVRAGAQHLVTARRSRSYPTDPAARVVADLVRARHLRARGDVAGALLLLEREEQPPGSWARLLRVEIASLSTAQGDAERAVRLLDDEPSCLDPAVSVTLGWARAALGEWDAVREVIDARPVPAGGSAASATGTGIGARLLHVALDLHTGQEARARTGLARCLRTAERETLRRPFREAPAPVRALLEQDVTLLAQHPWLRATADVRTRRTIPAPLPGEGPADDRKEAPTAPIEPLTAKETEVLGHMSELLTTEEIASAMFVSVNTVRTHVRNILRKLAVSRRNDAVRRARALSLVGQ